MAKPEILQQVAKKINEATRTADKRREERKKEARTSKDQSAKKPDQKSAKKADTEKIAPTFRDIAKIESDLGEKGKKAIQDAIYNQAEESAKLAKLALQAGNLEKARLETTNLLAWTTLAEVQRTSQYEKLFTELYHFQPVQKTIFREAASNLYELSELGFVASVGGEAHATKDADLGARGAIETAFSATKDVGIAAAFAEQAAIVSTDKSASKTKKEDQKEYYQRVLDKTIAQVMQKVQDLPQDQQKDLLYELGELRRLVRDPNIDPSKIERTLAQVDRSIEEVNSNLISKAKQEGADFSDPQKSIRSSRLVSVDAPVRGRLAALAVTVATESAQDPNTKELLRKVSFGRSLEGGAPDAATPADTDPSEPTVPNQQGNQLSLEEQVRRWVWTDDELNAAPERIARVARGIRARFLNDPNRYNDSAWMAKQREELERTLDTLTKKQAAERLGVAKPDDADMNDPLVKEVDPVDLRPFTDKLRNRENEIVINSGGMSKQNLESFKILEGELNERAGLLRSIRDRYRRQELDGGAPIPARIKNLVNQVEELMVGGEMVEVKYVDLVDGTDQIGLEFKPFSGEQFITKVRYLEDLMSSIDPTEFSEKNQLMSMVDLLKRRQSLVDTDRNGGYSRLGEAGLDTDQQKEFADIANEEFQMQRIYGDGADYEKNLKHLKEHAEDIAKQLLAVVDTDDTQFMNQLFNQLIHEPAYSNLITNLQQIVNELGARESSTGVVKWMKIKEWDRKLRREVEHTIKASDYVARIQNWIREEKNWKRISHDGYVLHLTHNFDYLSKMANTIEMGTVDALFAEEGVKLDVALSAYNQFAQTTYGMHWWKAPEGVFTRGENGKIPVDEHVRSVLRQQYNTTELTPKDLDRLTTLARGLAHVVTGEVTDITLSASAPPSDRHGLSLTEPYGNIGLNILITQERFQMDTPFQIFDFLYTKLGKKGGFLNYRHVPTEMHEAEQLRKMREKKGRPRFFRHEEFGDEGLAFMDSFEGLMQTGSWGNRGWGWRGEQAYMHLHVGKNGEYKPTEGKSGLDMLATTKNLAVVNPQVAMSIMEVWYGRGWVDRNELKVLRKIVWDRLKDVAPQAFVALDRGMLDHKKLDNRWRTMDEHKLTQVMLDAETITRYVINKTEGVAGAPTLDLLGNDEAAWLKALAPNEDERPKYVERARLAREFMTDLRTNAVGDMIVGNREHWKGTQFEKEGRVVALEDISFTRSMPAHYRTSLREAHYSATGGRTIGRMAGDNDTVATAAKEVIWKKMKQLVLDMQSDPERIRSSGYAEVAKVIREYADAVQAVHGTTSGQDKSASVYRASYILESAFVKWFNKGTLSRYVGASLDPRFIDASSWVNKATGRNVSEMDASEIRALVNTSIGQNLLAPYHGNAVKIYKPKISFGKKENGEPRWVKEFAALSLPELRWRKVGGVNIPVGLNRARWNATKFTLEHGASRNHLVLDIARSYIPLFLFLIVISALQKSQEDTK